MDHHPEVHGATIPGMTYCQKCGILLKADSKPSLVVSQQYCLLTSFDEDSLMTELASIIDAEAQSIGLPPSPIMIEPELAGNLSRILVCLPPFVLTDEEEEMSGLHWVMSISALGQQKDLKDIYKTYINVVYETLCLRIGIQEATHCMSNLLVPISNKLVQSCQQYYDSIESDPFETGFFFTDLKLIEFSTLLRIYTHLTALLDEGVFYPQLVSYESVVSAVNLAKEKMINSDAYPKTHEDYLQVVAYLNSRA